MKGGLFLLLTSYLFLLLLMVVGSKLLWAFRVRLWDGFTVGDLALAALVFFYGLSIYITALFFTRGSCKNRHRDH